MRNTFFLGVVSVLCASLFASAAPAPQLSRPQAPRNRLFPMQDLGLLDGPDRDQWQKPDQIMDALGIADGSMVGEIGAKGGWFTTRLARRVGPNGRVYAEDVQRPMVEAIERRALREGLTNIRATLGAPNDPRLPGGLNAVLIVGAYREIHDPVALLTRLAKLLKPQGRLGIVDFNPGAGGPGPAQDQRVDPEAVIRAAGAAGFRLIDREPVVPFQFLLVFARASGAR